MAIINRTNQFTCLPRDPSDDHPAAVGSSSLLLERRALGAGQDRHFWASVGGTTSKVLGKEILISKAGAGKTSRTTQKQKKRTWIPNKPWQMLVLKS